MNAHNTTATQVEAQTKISTIDISALEWFDKVNGNSYFAGTVTVNYGTPSAREYKMPFQYGYGDQYKHAAFDVLEENGEIKREAYANGSKTPIWQYCEDNNIVIRTTKHQNCKKSTLKNL